VPSRRSVEAAGLETILPRGNGKELASTEWAVHASAAVPGREGRLAGLPPSRSLAFGGYLDRLGRSSALLPNPPRSTADGEPALWWHYKGAWDDSGVTDA